MRQLTNFIDGFTQYLADKGAPKLYVKWAAIFTLSAAMERKCWVVNRRGKLFPSTFVLLVGPAGIGKGLCLNTSHDLLAALRNGPNTFHIAPSSVTKASLMDGLNAAERSIIRPLETPAIHTFNSITVIANEFGVFLPAWDGEFMAVLTDLWDAQRYSETRRTKNVSIEIPKAQINIFAGDTPTHLTQILPEGAWETGFMSRTMAIYSGESIRIPLFGEFEQTTELWDKLIHDTKAVHKMFGAFHPTDEFVEAINHWVMSGGEPAPTHPKLVGYSSRRAAHLLKLCMVASAATDDDMILTLDNFAEALDWLAEAESFMPDIFKAIKTGGDAQVIQECWHFAYEYFMRKGNKPVPEHLVYAFLQEKTPVHNVERLIDVMVRAQLLTKKFTDAGGTGYEPKAQRG